ncbi:MAG: serine/threonine protein kinase, partial [Planctomycetes bacterium]|nr:serine/threonine protein kinase [Planctomycetota bacterium]
KKPKQAKTAQQLVSARQKVLAEAVVTGEHDHPTIVPIYDVGRNEENALYYAKKNVVGTPWLDVIKSKSAHENLDILLSVCDAVAFAHARGVVHRDLKPENVMLGEFGEKLVMDWGLALPTEKFRKGGSVTKSNSMGGTPAYMAPEMATGPLEKIGPTSDIYLLGAILYEIVTGKPPHRGKNAMKCLMAAAKNQIEPTDKTGELVDIAMKAMETDPADRYQTVQDFKKAIGDYLSHTESIAMSARAEEDLTKAEETGDYDEYTRAIYGFTEAHDLWKGNRKAKAGLAAAKLAYARAALKREDYDLGLGQLDPQNVDHKELYSKLTAAKAERDARVHRIKTMKRVGVIGGSIALILVSAASVIAFIQMQRAEEQATIAENRRQEAVEATQQAIAAQKEADKQRAAAVASAEEAKQQR